MFRDLHELAVLMAAFVPRSADLIFCGRSRSVSHLILAGIFNSLILTLSHLLYAVHSVAGLFVLSYFHQAFENLFLATVYILMILKVPGRPLAVNGAVWGVMGLAMGFWPVILVAVPAGLAADRFIRAFGRVSRQNRAQVPGQAPRLPRIGAVLAGYCFYATALGVANGWPILWLKESAAVERTAQMDPVFSGLLASATLPLFLAQVAASLVTAVMGGFLALGLINRHFRPAGVV